MQQRKYAQQGMSLADFELTFSDGAPGEEAELLPGGGQVKVTEENLEQYLEASMLVDRIQQLDAGTKRQLAARSRALALDSSESDASSDAGGSAASDTDL